MKYTALIADIINSRQMTDDNRYKLQLFIKVVIGYLNTVFQKSLKSVVEISSGDSMQGLFSNPAAAFLYFRQLQILLYPIEVRGGIGEGRIYYEDNWKSSELEGPAYYNARKAIEYSKQSQLSNVCFNSTGKIDKYINSMLISSQSFEKRASMTINLIKMMGEFFFPLYKTDSMEYFEFINNAKLTSALNYKEVFYNILVNKTQESENIKGAYPNASKFNIPSLSECDLIDIETLYNKKKENIVNCFWKRGFSKKISLAMNNTSRQNVDKHLDGGIIEQRNLDGAICLLLIEKGDILS